MPSSIALPTDTAAPTSADATALGVLQEVFGYRSFRGPQAQVIEHVSAGGDALVLMPTGGGKSLCYQIPALLRQRRGLGVTLVISPLIALMHDQVGALREAGVRAAFLNSSLSAQEASAVEHGLWQGAYTLLYAAPERVVHPRFLALTDALAQRGGLALFAIDEAHCVSQWGHDFRPEYRALSVLHHRFPAVPRVALTATADALTRQDILEHLNLQQARCFVSSFDRPNISYTIVEKHDGLAQLVRFIAREHAQDAGIVYCQSRRRVEDVAHALVEHGFNALPYHAGLDAAVRQQHQDRFLREDGLVMVATIAFGMGIDKPDVRFVAHLDMPKNIEGYYQETGRAGRDGAPAQAWMCYGLQDVVNQRRMIDESSAADAFKQVLRDKLEALLGLAETTECRRARLLEYFGETASAPPQGTPFRCQHCDNCLHPPALWDATQAARQLLSTIYRVQEHSHLAFGAGHILDIVRGKRTPKVEQYGHSALSTFGMGADLSERQLRSVLRQLLAMGAVAVDAQAFQTLHLTALARPVLRGEVPIRLHASSGKPEPETRGKRKPARAPSLKAPLVLNGDALLRYAALKAWRATVAREHDLPAFVIFHDTTLAAIAQQHPESLQALQDISGIGARKLDAYGEAVLRVMRA